MTKVFTVIVTYNALPWIDDCLKSTRESSLQSKVIIIDNNSQDNTINHIRTNFPECILISQKKNLGFGRANNIGISKALKLGAEYVMLLNQDAYLQKDTLQELITAYSKNSEFGVISPVHLKGEGKGLDYWFSRFIKQNSDLEHTILKKKSTNNLYELPFVNAAAWLVPKQTLTIIGGFDPIFFHYREDDNYCQRLHYHGFKIGVLTGVYIRHDREKRKTKRPKLFSSSYFLMFEQNLKVKYANVNVSYDKNIKFKEMYRTFKKIIKSALQLNLRKVKGYYKEFIKLNRIFKEIESSRSKNINKANHYLSI